MLLLDKGLKVKTSAGVIGLDYSDASCDYCFLSHGHSDHIFKTNKPVLCSDETREFSKIKGYDVKNASLKCAELVDSGHILGSKSLILNDECKKLVFTADFSLRNKGFIKGFSPVKCDELIIESTFGTPEFLFPDFNTEMKKAKDWVDDNNKKGCLSVLCGYSLGKSQAVQNYFKEYNSNVHDSVKPYNSVYEKYGVNLPNSKDLSKSSILFAPILSRKNDLYQRLKSTGKVKFAVFSGWNIHSDYKYRFGADEGFTISDHADFKELLTTVHKCEPSKVYVNHGFSKEFAKFLKLEGYDAAEL